MSEYLIQGGTLTEIANEVRTLTGVGESLSPDAMATNINEANEKISSQADLLAQIQSALEGKTAGGSADPVLQEKTATPTTSSQTITPDSGYDGLSKVTVNAMPTATQATPSISVSSAGLITASATQSAGYVSAGTKSATKQLTTQAAKTVTPTTSNQTAVASGRYTTGAITVKGDANLKADNITQGISIFGVAGANPYEKNATTTEINTQATKLDELKTILAGKATGGGGGVETCTVNLKTTTYVPAVIYSTVDENGKVTSINSGYCNIAGKTITCICGTLIIVSHNGATFKEITGAEVLFQDDRNLTLKITSSANETVDVTIDLLMI